MNAKRNVISVPAKVCVYHKGFTLIEVLIVLIIISIITAIAALSFGHFGRGRREKIIIQQFTRAITSAQQQAILTPMVLGLTITKQGYQFYQFQMTLKKSSKWIPLKNDVLSNSTAFQHNLAEARPVGAGALILFLPSGYVTPFTLELKGDGRVFQIAVQDNGAISK